MATTTTSNLGLIKPTAGTNEPASVFTSHNPNMDALDAHHHGAGNAPAIKRVQSGTFAGRPAAGSAGHVYVATDTGQMFFDNGVAWVGLVAADSASSVSTSMLAANAATQRSTSTLASDVSTVSTTFVDVHATNATLTITATGGPVLVMWSGPLNANTSSAFLTFSEGAVDGPVLAEQSASALNHPVTIHRWFQPAAGVVTYKVRFRTDAGGTANILAASRANGVFTVIEFKR